MSIRWRDSNIWSFFEIIQQLYRTNRGVSRILRMGGGIFFQIHASMWRFRGRIFMLQSSSQKHELCEPQPLLCESQIYMFGRLKRQVFIRLTVNGWLSLQRSTIQKLMTTIQKEGARLVPIPLNPLSDKRYFVEPLPIKVRVKTSPTVQGYLTINIS